MVDIIHPKMATVPKKEVQSKLAKMYKVLDENLVVVFGLRTAFGGGKSTGFGLIYDSSQLLARYEPKHRKIRAGLLKKVERSRQQIKVRKNKANKAVGLKKAEILKSATKK